MTDEPVIIRLTLDEGPRGETHDETDPEPRWWAEWVLAIGIPLADLRWHPGDRAFGRHGWRVVRARIEEKR